MGAISASRSVPILKEYLSDPERTVRETCEIAIDKIQWDHSEEGKSHVESLKENPTLCVTRQKHGQDANLVSSPYTSIDPAPATSGLLSGTLKPDDLSTANVTLLQSKLLNTQLQLFERYRAMFALRNIGTPAAVDALASGFSDSSALFKYLIRSVAVNPANIRWQA